MIDVTACETYVSVELRLSDDFLVDFFFGLFPFRLLVLVLVQLLGGFRQPLTFQPPPLGPRAVGLVPRGQVLLGEVVPRILHFLVILEQGLPHVGQAAGRLIVLLEVEHGALLVVPHLLSRVPLDHLLLERHVRVVLAEAPVNEAADLVAPLHLDEQGLTPLDNTQLAEPGSSEWRGDAPSPRRWPWTSPAGL